MSLDPRTASVPPRGGPRLLPVVLALGATQVIGYGTLYYAYAILAPAIAGEFGTSLTSLYAIFSVGLLAGGLVAPQFGAWMDRYGAPRIMAAGSLVMAILVGGLAAAPTLWTFGACVIAIEVVGIAVLYDAAFATLAALGRAEARRAITHLTLIAGFASTIFWPLTGWLVEVLGWRGPMRPLPRCTCWSRCRCMPGSRRGHAESHLAAPGARRGRNSAHPWPMGWRAWPSGPSRSASR